MALTDQELEKIVVDVKSALFRSILSIDEVYVIVDIETHQLRRCDNIFRNEDDAFELSRQFENSTVITLDEYLKEIE